MARESLPSRGAAHRGAARVARRRAMWRDVSAVSGRGIDIRPRRRYTPTMPQPSRAERRRRARERGAAPPSAASRSPAPAPRAAGTPGAGVPPRPALRRRGTPAWRWWAAGAAAAAVLAAAGWWWLAPRAGAGHGPLIEGDRVAYEGNTHVPVGTPIHYRAQPPASGDHYPDPAAPGVYPGGLLPGHWVHNLEHGYIVLAYRPPATPRQLRELQHLQDSLPRSKWGFVKLVVVPYEGMPHPYALLAWTWRLWLDRLDPETVAGFYRAHVDRGPEDVP
jgi:hypothetical protein